MKRHSLPILNIRKITTGMAVDSRRGEGVEPLLVLSEPLFYGTSTLV